MREKSSIRGNSCVSPLTVENPMPAVVSASCFPERYSWEYACRFVVVDAEYPNIIYRDGNGYGYKTEETARKAYLYVKPGSMFYTANRKGDKK